MQGEGWRLHKVSRKGGVVLDENRRPRVKREAKDHWEEVKGGRKGEKNCLVGITASKGWDLWGQRKKIGEKDTLRTKATEFQKKSVFGKKKRAKWC